VHHRATILDLRTTTSAEFISITVLAAMLLFPNKISQYITENLLLFLFVLLDIWVSKKLGQSSSISRKINPKLPGDILYNFPARSVPGTSGYKINPLVFVLGKAKRVEVLQGQSDAELVLKGLACLE